MSYPYQYAQLPSYQWQTYNPHNVTFSLHPIIPPRRFYTIDPFADERYKHEERLPAGDATPEASPRDERLPDVNGKVPLDIQRDASLTASQT
jgi:hypothetical protein